MITLVEGKAVENTGHLSCSKWRREFPGIKVIWSGRNNREVSVKTSRTAAPGGIKSPNMSVQATPTALEPLSVCLRSRTCRTHHSRVLKSEVKLEVRLITSFLSNTRCTKSLENPVHYWRRGGGEDFKYPLADQ